MVHITSQKASSEHNAHMYRAKYVSGVTLSTRVLQNQHKQKVCYIACCLGKVIRNKSDSLSRQRADICSLFSSFAVFHDLLFILSSVHRSFYRYTLDLQTVWLLSGLFVCQDCLPHPMTKVRHPNQEKLRHHSVSGSFCCSLFLSCALLQVPS